MSRKGKDESNSLERGVKSQAIRDALAQNSSMKNGEIAEMLSKRGIPTTTQDVANQKTKLKKQNLAGAKANFTVEDLMKVKEVVKDNGGIDKVNNILGQLESIASQAGGMEKLRKGIDTLATLSGKG